MAIKNLLWLLVLASSITHAQIYRWVDEQGKVHFGDKPPQTEETLAESLSLPGQSSPSTVDATESVADERDAAASSPNYQPPGVSETLRIRQLFERGEFRQLNTLLENHQNATQKNIASERALIEAYDAFDVAFDEGENQFENWLKQYPSYYQPYLARAHYYYGRAWQERGGEYIHKVSEEKRAAMEALLDLAKADLSETLRLQRHALAAYSLQISISNTLGDRDGARTAMTLGIELYPYSYRIRSAYMNHLQPRWGGSFQQMQDYAARAQYYVEHNPRLRHLLVNAHEDMLRYLFGDKQYQQVIAIASEIIEFHAGTSAYYYRGRSHYRLKDYASARDDFSEAIQIAPEADNFYYWRARANNRLNASNQSLRDINRAYALNPESEKIAKYRDNLLSRVLIRHVESVQHDPYMGRIRVKPDPKDPEALFNYAKTQIIHKQFEGAVASLDQAIDLNAGEIRYYLLIDDLLFKLGRSREMLGYWGRYLVHQPEDGRAYFERSGTYYHLQDFDAALADAERAIALGNDKAYRARDELRALMH